jgi:CHAD domain-containing protein
MVLEALRAQVAELRAQEPGTRAAAPNAVARMRVATRQLRNTLDGFSRLLDKPAARAVSQEFKWLGAQLAGERDTQVIVERLSRDVHVLPGEMVIGPIVADLRAATQRFAEQCAQTVIAAVHSPRYQELLRLLDQLTTNPPFTRRAERPAHTELPKSLAKAVRRLDRRLAEAASLPPGRARDDALHEARKADKRVRYMSEIVIPLLDEPARRLHHQTEKLQKLLGEHQDSVVARSALRRLATEAHGQGHNAFTYGLLYAIEYRRAERVLRELPNRLAGLHAPRTVSWLPARSQSRHEPPPAHQSNARARRIRVSR